MPVSLQHSHLNGNGRVRLPQSRRDFQRSLPLRLGDIEVRLDAYEQQVDELVGRLAALEARADDTADTARVELVRGVIDILRLALGKRRRPRRLRPRGPSNNSK